MTHDITLPPLPNILGLTATRVEQIMRAYARDAVLAERERCAWLARSTSAKNKFPLTAMEQFRLNLETAIRDGVGP